MNLGRKPLFVLDQECQEITNRVVREVEKAGLQTMRSFDLDLLRSSGQGFCCPIHATSACTCHYVILLVMSRELGSVTIILEGMDHQTSVYLDTGLGTADKQINPSLTLALVNAFFPNKILR